ncbi:MAG: hypothetical protein MAG794_00282 [Gammaproteobacteria bacterium]|nr:hypothetical protein [Gammaproteobacteria bacterium]
MPGPRLETRIVDFDDSLEAGEIRPIFVEVQYTILDSGADLQFTGAAVIRKIVQSSIQIEPSLSDFTTGQRTVQPCYLLLRHEFHGQVITHCVDIGALNTGSCENKRRFFLYCGNPRIEINVLQAQVIIDYDSIADIHDPIPAPAVPFNAPLDAGESDGMAH